jgi:hypothetical protein
MATTDHGSSQSSGAGFLSFLGLALIGAGAGFAFAPHYSWQVVKIARQAQALGLDNGTLVVGGLVLLGLAVLAKNLAAASAPRDNTGEIQGLQSELALVNEQVANKFSQVRAALQQVGEGVSSISAMQATQMHQPGEKTDAEAVREAVFRLAASLDKLHAHFDERLHAVDLQLRSGFETLLGTSQELRRQLELHSAPAPHAAHAAPVQPLAANPADPFGPIGEGPAPNAGIDFYQTMQKLDAISGESSAPAGRGRAPQAPFPSQGSGQSLDALLPEEYRNRY